MAGRKQTGLAFGLSVLMNFIVVQPFDAFGDSSGGGGGFLVPKKPVITFAVVNEDKDKIDINGENLHIDGKTTVILGRNGTQNTPVDIILTVLDTDDDGKQVIVELPPGVADGTHLLTINTQRGKAEYHAVVGPQGSVGGKTFIGKGIQTRIRADALPGTTYLQSTSAIKTELQPTVSAFCSAGTDVAISGSCSTLVFPTAPIKYFLQQSATYYNNDQDNLSGHECVWGTPGLQASTVIVQAAVDCIRFD